MLIEMKSPAFKKQGEERPPIRFKVGLNVVLGKEDGAMSIGKSSSLLAIDFVYGGDTYIKSDGVKKEGHHTIFFTLCEVYDAIAKLDSIPYCLTNGVQFIDNLLALCPMCHATYSIDDSHWL